MMHTTPHKIIITSRKMPAAPTVMAMMILVESEPIVKEEKEIKILKIVSF